MTPSDHCEQHLRGGFPVSWRFELHGKARRRVSRAAETDLPLTSLQLDGMRPRHLRRLHPKHGCLRWKVRRKVVLDVILPRRLVGTPPWQLGLEGFVAAELILEMLQDAIQCPSMCGQLFTQISFEWRHPPRFGISRSCGPGTPRRPGLLQRGESAPGCVNVDDPVAKGAP